LGGGRSTLKSQEVKEGRTGRTFRGRTAIAPKRYRREGFWGAKEVRSVGWTLIGKLKGSSYRSRKGGVSRGPAKYLREERKDWGLGQRLSLFFEKS